uniref:Uncharacterized protein n=1 Tax=viral metagenome TaxID=1070528 RepID=A0A6C0JVU9_9ZZZZ
MSLSDYQFIESYLADRPMSENAKIDILDACKVYLDVENQYHACCRALSTCGLPEEDPEYMILEDACSEAHKALEIAWNNYRDIYYRLFR